MQTDPNKSEFAPAPTKPAIAKPPDIAAASVPDTLAALHVNPDTGLTHAEVDIRRKEHGYTGASVSAACRSLPFVADLPT
jgi:hypothetical protein